MSRPRWTRYHHLIVAHEVTNVGNDRGQLATMAKQAQAAMGRQELEVLADRGYYPCVPDRRYDAVCAEATDLGQQVGGTFRKAELRLRGRRRYLALSGGRAADLRYISVEHGMNLYVYWTTACSGCPIKAKCTTGKERRIKRWEHETVLDAMQQRLDEAPKKMEVRRQTAEHPFGTIKAWMGSTLFLTKTLPKVSTEMSLHVLAYNLKRVMKVLGVVPLKEAMQA